jgi:bacterioferritin-associated ferredoxin
MLSVNEILDLTPALQCCLRCRRLLTDRVLHDAMEEPVLASIRAGHSELASPNETCQPCIEEYRNLLKEREVRSLGLSAEAKLRRPSLIARLFERRFDSSQA